jgi:hypothetical protein
VSPNGMRGLPEIPCPTKERLVSVHKKPQVTVYAEQTSGSAGNGKKLTRWQGSTTGYGTIMPRVTQQQKVTLTHSTPVSDHV